MVNLLEEVAVLAYRDDGRNGAPYLQLSLASAAVMELRLQDRIDLDKYGFVDVVRPDPVGHSAVDEVLRRLVDSKARHLVSSWVQILSAVDLAGPVLDGLIAQRVLTHERGRRLGFIPVNRYHPTDGRLKAAIRQRLERAFSHGAGVDARTAALAGILVTTLMQHSALPQHKYGAIHRVFGELVKSHPPVRQVVDGIRLAVTAPGN